MLSGVNRPFHPDVIQEAIYGTVNTLKLTTDPAYKVELHVLAWSKKTPKQFLVHVLQTLDTIRQKGFLTVYKNACKEQEKHPQFGQGH